jgi:hypothetical protein
MKIEIDREFENRIKKMIKFQEQLENEAKSGFIEKTDTYEQLIKIESSIAMTICAIYRSDKVDEIFKKFEDEYNKNNRLYQMSVDEYASIREKAKEIFLSSLEDIL